MLIVYILIYWEMPSDHSQYENEGYTTILPFPALQYTCTLYFVLQMTSVERILEYCGLPPEAAYESSEDKLSTGWPHDGSIVFDNASFRYSEKGSLVLKDICATINSNEKVVL